MSEALRVLVLGQSNSAGASLPGGAQPWPALLAGALPAALGPKADPLATPEVIKPEWYFYVAFRWLKLFSGSVALLSMGFIVFVMFAWPFIDGWLRKTTKLEEISVYVGIAGAFAIIGLTLWEAIAPH